METKNLFDGLEDLISGKSAQPFVSSQDGLESDLFGKQDNADDPAPDKSDDSDKKDGKEDEGISLEEAEALTKGKADDEDDNKASKEKADNKEDREDKDEEDSKDDDKTQVYKGLAAFLKEEGILEDDEEFDSPDKMKEVFSSIIKKEYESWKESLPDDIKDIINNYEDGVPYDELIQTKSNMVRYNSITEEQLANEDVQKAIYTNYLKATTKYSDEKIEREVKRLADLDELGDEAKSGLEELKKLEQERENEIKIQAKKEQEAQAKQREERVQKLNERVKSVKEIIPGVKVSDKEATELFKMLTTPVELRGNDAISAVRALREKDPDDFDIKLNYFIKKGFFEGKFEDIAKKAETKATKNLEKGVEAAAAKLLAKQGGNPGSYSAPSGSKSEELLSAMKTLPIFNT